MLVHMSVLRIENLLLDGGIYDIIIIVIIIHVMK